MMLTGFPLKQFKINKIDEDGNKTPIWVSHDLLQSYLSAPCDTYEVTEETRMTYAPPAWLPKEENPNGTLVLLDDYNRASNVFLAAVMELICEGSYIGWNLPKYTQIILSKNPDNGAYSVNSEDPAMKTRYVSFNVDFDIKLWARWAENIGLDSRAINFAVFNADQLFKNDGVSAVNARNYTMFCNTISGIKDWSDTKSLGTILDIAKGCFEDENNIVGKLFTMFIANKLDKLISPEDLLMGNWDTVSAKAKSCVYENGKYRADIAAVLATRLLNYSLKYFATKGSKEAVVTDRIIKFVEASSSPSDRIFAEDLIFDIANNLVSKFPGKTNKLMMNAKIRKALL